MTTLPSYRKQLQQEVDALPEEYLPYILQIVQTFRESVMLKPAAESLKQGWHSERSQSSCGACRSHMDRWPSAHSRSS